MDLEKIKEYVKEKHKGQTRIQGTPYFDHPLAVSKILKVKGFNLDYQVVGLIHDLLKDTDASEEEILSLTNEDVLKAVKVLTKDKNYIMNDYINSIKENEIAKIVKLADRVHNLSEAHYASLEFISDYIKETREWYVPISYNTPFEKDIEYWLLILEEKFK